MGRPKFSEDLGSDFGGALKSFGKVGSSTQINRELFLETTLAPLSRSRSRLLFVYDVWHKGRGGKRKQAKFILRLRRKKENFVPDVLWGALVIAKRVFAAHMLYVIYTHMYTYVYTYMCMS